MTAVMARPATAPETGSRSAAHDCTATALYVWGLSVDDWQVHALAQPGDDGWGMLATRCGVWQAIGCPVTVARRGEVCARCVAGGMQRLELLPDRSGR